MTATTAAPAQRLQSRFPVWQPLEITIPRTLPPRDEDRSGEKLLGGLLVGAAGLFGGGLLGAALASDNNCYYWCGFAGAVVGATVLEGIGLGLGVHLGEPRSDKLFRRLTLPLLVGVGGLLVSAVAESAWPLLAVVPIQFVVSW